MKGDIRRNLNSDCVKPVQGCGYPTHIIEITNNIHTSGWKHVVDQNKEESSPFLKLKIRDIPKVLNVVPDQQQELIYFNRLAPVLAKFEISSDSLILQNPFHLGRLSRYLHGKFTVYGGVTNFEYASDSYDSLELDIYGLTRHAQIAHGIHFVSMGESYIGSQSDQSWIIFENGKGLWDEEHLAKFIVDFSAKLRSFKIQAVPQDKDAFKSIFLPDSILKDIRGDIEGFLESRKLYVEDLDLAWRRGYMLIGPPGNGKSLLIRKICQFYGLEHFDIKKAITRDGDLNMSKAVENSVDYFLFPTEEMPRVCVLEDIDKFTAFQSGEMDKDYGTLSLHSLLKGIDGIDQTDGIILIATSNFPDVLHEALVGRPGRFDKIYSIDKPTPEDIRRLLSYYQIVIKDGLVQDIAEKLKGSSMAFAAEFVKSAKMKYKRNEITLEECKGLLEAIHKHQELCKSHFKEQKKIGFQ